MIDNVYLVGKNRVNYGICKLFYQIHCSFSPGNHELWIRSTKSRPNTLENSIQKFHEIIELCNTVGVHTKPVKVHCHGSTGGDVWLVPLFSWYTQPEENKTDSLYVEGRNENREISKSLWMDNHLCKWPETQVTISKYFENLNKELLAMEYDSPVISFSHFLPRQELIIPTEDEIKSIEKERQAMGLEQLNNPRLQGATAGFNFSRYAGCKSLERQIRKLGSNIHIHGHQHRNRDRAIDGVQYISFCLGYPRERSQGLMWGFSRFNGPKQVWPCL